VKTIFFQLTILLVFSFATFLSARAVRLGGEEFPEDSIGASHLKALLNDSSFRANLQRLQSELNQQFSERREHLQMSLMTFESNLAESYRKDVINSTYQKEHIIDRLLHMNNHARLSHQWFTLNDHSEFCSNLEHMLARVALYVEKNPMDIYITHPKKIIEAYESFCPIDFPFYEKDTKKNIGSWILPFKEMLTGYVKTYNFSDMTLTANPKFSLMPSPKHLLHTESVGPKVTGEVLYQVYGPHKMQLAIPMVEHFIIPLITLMRQIQKEHIVRIGAERSDRDRFLIDALKEFGFDYSEMVDSENTRL
jgi:hypothetical protein